MHQFNLPALASSVKGRYKIDTHESADLAALRREALALVSDLACDGSADAWRALPTDVREQADVILSRLVEQNYDLLRGLHNLCSLGYPVLAGVSRKSMIYKVLDTTPDRALAGTIALGWECLRQGAAILRVHDVQEAVDTVRIFKAFRP